MRFVDTNVLLYAVSKDQAEASKTQRAREILDETDLALSVQVLQEFYVQATRAARPGHLSHTDAVGLVESLQRFPVIEITVSLLRAALATRDRFGISYWDAAIVEAGKQARCEELLSEDLADGQDYGGIRVVNPFAR